MPAKYLYHKAVEIFWRRASVGDAKSCWNWTGCRSPKGYGHLSFQGIKEKSHRLSWRLTFGEIPEGLCVCHKCDNPSCCNPYHLFLGTVEDNNNDKISKGRQAKLGGESNPSAILNREKVELIRELYKTENQIQISKRMGVARTTIGAIVRGEIWKEELSRE